MAGTQALGLRRALASALAIVLLAGLLVAAPLGAPAVAAAAPGDLDSSFGSGGSTTTGLGGNGAKDVALQPDGKIVTVGTVNATAGGFSTNKYAVGRHLPSGAPDPEFGTNGLVLAQSLDGSDDSAYTVAIQPTDGKIVAAGVAGGELGVIRLLPNGDLDPTFSGDGRQKLPGGSGISVARSAAIAPDGKIVLGGFRRDGGTGANSNFFVVRLNSDGSFDASFDGDGIAETDFTAGPADVSEINEISVAANGTVLAVGFTTVSGATDKDWAIARYLPSGALDTSFSGDGRLVTSPSGLAGDDVADGVAIRPDGRIVIAGEGAPNAADRPMPQVPIQVLQLLDDGSLDTSFGSAGRTGAGIDGNFNVRDLLLQPNGTIVVGSSANFENDGSNGYTGRQVMIQRFTVNGSGAGSSLTNFTAGNEIVNALALQPDGGLVGAGDGGPGFLLFRYAGDPPLPGEGIVFASTLGGSGLSGLKVARPDGSGLDPVTLKLGPGPNADPVWSPDGTKIAYVSPRAGAFQARLYVYDLITGKESAVMPTSVYFDADPAWHPSGTRLAFASDREGNFDVWSIDLAADNSGIAATLTNLTDAPSWDSFPAYGPDGSLVFQSTRDGGDFDIFRLDPAGVLSQVTADRVDDVQPALSPDGATVAFGNSDRIGLQPVAGGPASTVPAPAGAKDALPDWSPDGTELVFERAIGDQRHVVVSKTDGSSVRIISAVAGDGSEPHWFAAASLSVDKRTVSASPSKVPFDAIPTQQNSPATQEAVRTSGLQIPPSLVPLQISPSLVPLQISPSLVGLQIPPSLVPLQISPSLVPAAIDRLKATPFSTLKFNEPASAKAVLEGSALANRPFQEFSVHDALVDQVAGPRLRALPFAQIDLTEALGDVGLGTLLLGSTKFADMKSPAVDVCASLTGLGYGAAGQCGGDAFAAPGPNGPDPRNGLGARPVDLAVARVPLTDPTFPINLHLIKMGEISLASDAALLEFDLSRMDLLRDTNFGSIRVVDLPASTKADPSAIDCSGERCTGETTLYQAKLAGTIKAGFRYRHLGATVASFGLGEVVHALAGVASVPYGDFTTKQLGILGYQGPGTQRVTYTARHRIPAGTTGTTSVKLDLPGTFAPLAGAALSVDGGPGVAPVITPGLASTSFVWNVSAAPGASLVASVPVAPGVYTGEHRADLVVSSPGRSRKLDRVAPVRVVRNNEPDTSPATATPLTTNSLQIGHTTGVHYFTLEVPADQIVDIELNNRESGDNDLVVYHPVDAAGVRPEDRLVAVTANEPVPLPLKETPGGNRFGEAVAGGTAQDVPLLDRPVAALSDTRNRANERASFRSLAVPGRATSTYIVQVSSYLSQASSGPYTLFATSRPAPGVNLACPARSGVNSTARPTNFRGLPAVSTSTKTLFLVNQARLSEVYGADATTAFLTKVDALAAHPKVNGVVVPLDADANFRQKMSAWDAVPCDPLRSNAVVRAGNDVIASLTAGPGTDVRHVVLLGSPDVLPRGLLPDASQAGNEAQFQSELASLFSSNNSLLGAGQHLATDDPWGAVEARAYGPRFLYPPVRAVGRLGESPAEMSMSIDVFLDSTVNGSLDRTTAATFGAYFMKDLATAIDEALAKANTNAPAGSRKIEANDSWTSDALRSTINAPAPPGLISVHTHANPFGLAAPGDTATPFRPTDLDTAAAKLRAKVLLTIGCHSATSVADVLFSAGAQSPADFAQASTRNGALLLGQTGYGLGLDGSLAFSERLMTYLVEEIGRSSTIGEALVAAKQRYLANGLVSPYDEKALAGLSLNGLTMFDFGSSASPPPTTSAAQASNTDPISGLPTATFSITPTLRKVPRPDGIYYESATSPTVGLGETHAAPERPILPQVTLDVTQPSGVARGAWTTARTYATPEVIDPVIAAATLAGASAAAPEQQPSDVVYPVVPITLTKTINQAGMRQQLRLLPSQFVSTGKVNGKTQGRLRNTTSESLTVFYGPAVLTDTTPPEITSVAALKEGTKVRFAMTASDPQSNVVRASAFFEDGAGTKYVELKKLGTEWTGEATFSGTEVRVEFRALNGQGLVGRAVDKAFGFLAITPPSAPAGTTARVIDSPISNGFYSTNAKVELSGVGQSFEYRLNVDPWRPYTGPVPVSTPGFNRVTYRVSGGASSVLAVPVSSDAVPPAITITSPADKTVVTPGTVLTLGFSCTDESAVTRCSADVPGRTNLSSGSTFTVPAGPSQVVVTATDAFGNQSTKSVTVTGAFTFDGFFAPVQNGVLNRANAGRTIPMKWRLYDAAGEVKTLDVVKVLSSQQVPCDPNLLVVDVPDLIILNLDGLSYTGTNYQYGWKTSVAWTGQCRDFRVRLSDGREHQAKFKFF